MVIYVLVLKDEKREEEDVVALDDPEFCEWGIEGVVDPEHKPEGDKGENLRNAELPEATKVLIPWNSVAVVLYNKISDPRPDRMHNAVIQEATRMIREQYRDERKTPDPNPPQNKL